MECKTKTDAFIPAAEGIVAKSINVKTLSGQSVTVKCDSSAVRSYPSPECFCAFDNARFADCLCPATEHTDLIRPGVQMPGWSLRAGYSREIGDCGVRR